MGGTSIFDFFRRIDYLSYYRQSRSKSHDYVIQYRDFDFLCFCYRYNMQYCSFIILSTTRI